MYGVLQGYEKKARAGAKVRRGRAVETQVYGTCAGDENAAPPKGFSLDPSILKQDVEGVHGKKILFVIFYIINGYFIICMRACAANLSH